MNFLVFPIGKKVEIVYKTFFKLFQTVLIMLKYLEPEESRYPPSYKIKLQIHHQSQKHTKTVSLMSTKKELKKHDL